MKKVYQELIVDVCNLACDVIVTSGAVTEDDFTDTESRLYAWHTNF